MNLSRLSAASSITLAALLLSLGFLPLVFLEANEPAVSWVLDPAWPVLSLLAFLLSMLTPAVLMGLYAFQRPQLGTGGFLGLVLAVVGLLIYVAFQFDMAFVWPVLATYAPELVAFDGPMFRFPSYSFVHFWMGPVTSVGILLFGGATYRGRVFPRWVAVLFTLGMLLTQGILFPPLILRTVGSMPGALALFVMGLSQWRGRAPESPVA